MKYSTILRYVLILFGEVLLIAVLFFYFKEYTDEAWFRMDLLVLSFIYLANVLIQPALFVSGKRFSEQVTGYGVSWFFTGLYSFLGIAGVIAGYLLAWPVEWQCLYQLAFLLIYGIGIYWSRLAIEKFREVKQEMKHDYKGIDRLKDQVITLKLTALDKALSRNIQDEIRHLEERIGYISPCPEAGALILEGKLGEELRDLLFLVQSNPVQVVDLDGRIRHCNNIITERLKFTIND